MKNSLLILSLYSLILLSFFIPHLWVFTTLSISLLLIEKVYTKKMIDVLK
ncbi:hypothetical protein [Arcobacter sp. LA11]|nr:hypothetical protein [Arcobacter sp. LA11]